MRLSTPRPHGTASSREQNVTPQAIAKSMMPYTAEMKYYHQSYQKGLCMSHWQGMETGKRLDLLGLHVWLHDASTVRSIGSEEDSTCRDREPLFV